MSDSDEKPPEEDIRRDENEVARRRGLEEARPREEGTTRTSSGRTRDEPPRRTLTSSTTSASATTTSTTTATISVSTVSDRMDDGIGGTTPPSYEAVEGETLWSDMQRVRRKLRDVERNNGSPTTAAKDGADNSSKTGRKLDGIDGSEAPPPPPGHAPASTTLEAVRASSAAAEGETLWSEMQRVRRKLRQSVRSSTFEKEGSKTLPSGETSADNSAPESSLVDDRTLVPKDANLDCIILESPLLIRVARPVIEPGAYRMRPQGRMRLRSRRGNRRVDDDDDSEDDENDVDDEGDNGCVSLPDGSTEHSESVTTGSTLPYGAGLVSAEPIYEDDDDDIKPSIVAQATPLRRRKRLLLLILMFVVLTAVGVAVAIALTTQNNGGGSTSPTSAPTAEIPLNMSELLGQFFDDLPAETAAAMNDESSPQSKAYQWINESIQLNSTFFQQESDKSILSRMTQRFALATLYYATGGPAWQINPNNWLDANVDECAWSGSTCSSGPGVYGLDLSSKGLVGTIPMEVSFLAPSLNILSLASNTLKGTLPSQLGTMSTLQQLHASSIQLQGSIPTSFGLLTALTFLDLSQNALKGPIPPALGNLSSLSYLMLSDNSLTGNVPSELGLVTNLDSLQIAGNNLSGAFPPELCALVPNGLVLRVDCTLSCDCCGC